MAKVLRTSGDYKIKAGAGAGGTNQIDLDSKQVRVRGDLIIDGDQARLNVTNMSVEDQFIELNRNNSTAGTEDVGILFNRGDSNAALIYYDAGNSEFQLGTTTQDEDGSTITEITNITLGQLKIASTPTDNNHAASKSYVDSQVTGGSGFFLSDEASTTITVGGGGSLNTKGDGNTNTLVTGDTLSIGLNQNLSNINSISTGSSNGDLTLVANGTGEIVIENILTFSGAASTPTADTVTKVYNKTAGGGGTGLYFINSNISSGAEGELISKKKATALAIALG